MRLLLAHFGDQLHPTAARAGPGGRLRGRFTPLPAQIPSWPLGPVEYQIRAWTRSAGSGLWESSPTLLGVSRPPEPPQDLGPLGLGWQMGGGGIPGTPIFDSLMNEEKYLITYSPFDVEEKDYHLFPKKKRNP